MTVLELIEMLSKYDEAAGVFVEVNHDEVVKLDKMPVEVEMTVGGVIAFEEDEDTKSAVVIVV